MIIGVDASALLRPRVTGTERYARQIIHHLLALPESKRHQWRLYAPGPEPRSGLPHPKQWEWIDLPYRPIWTHRILGAELRHRPPDLLFVPAHVIPIMPPSRLPPSVVTLHDVGFRYFPHTHGWKERLYLELSTRWSVARASRVIAVSGATANDLNDFFGVSPTRSRVIYEGVETRTRRQISNTDADVNVANVDVIQKGRPFALFLGTIQPRKNLARLIQAYGLLAQKGDPGWDLVLAGGRGWLSDPIYGMVDKLNLKQSVRFLGYVAEETLTSLLERASFLALPSLHEGFGLPILEAQQMGIPVMCSNRAALPEVAGDAALLVDPMDVDAIANAMLRISRDEPLRQQLIEAGYENVKRFSWQKAARETLAVLEEAVEDR